MIVQYRFTLTEDSKRPLPSFWAYRLYAWLLMQIDDDYADMLHAPGEKPISQYLYWDRNRCRNIWTVNFLDEKVASRLKGKLDSLAEISLHTGTLNAHLDTICERTASQLIMESRQQDKARRTVIRFMTPTAFKSNGRYAIFPQEKWLLQALIVKWNFTFPQMPMNDIDAFGLLVQGLHITDYSLRTMRYPLKNVKIPGFLGSITVELSLPAPMEEIWHLLLCFSSYTGAGIKTTLGMGGIKIEFLRS